MMYFRLSVFVAVARNLNFTKAAKELNISQPAISKHIQELEGMYNVQLFERLGGPIKITPAGQTFLTHAQIIIENYKRLESEMTLFSGNCEGILRIGASTTIAQYLLSHIVAKFLACFPNVQMSILTENSKHVEQAVEKGKIDLGLVEGTLHRKGLKYKLFEKEELVIVTSVHNTNSEDISLSDFKTLPMVLREEGSGTLEVVESRLADHSLNLSDLNVLLRLGSAEAIKSFLLNFPIAYTIISSNAVSNELMENKLKIVNIPDLSFQREFFFVEREGTNQELCDKFIQFTTNRTMY